MKDSAEEGMAKIQVMNLLKAVNIQQQPVY